MIKQWKNRHLVNSLFFATYNNSLIKCGTNAPHDVLRQLYKSAKLTGKVKNSNGEVLLHNYFNNPQETLE